MAKLIISAVSQLSNVKTTPPKFAVDTNPNEMPASKEKAPVLLSIASAGTVEADEFAERFAGKCSHLDVVEAIRRINALGEVLADCAAEGKNLQLGYLNLEVSVSGTIPDTNAELNEANVAFYSAVPSEKIRKQFAAIETHIPTTVCPADVKRVRDVATGDSAIHNTDPFFIQGGKLTQGGEGEKIELFDESGVTKIIDVSVLDATSKVSNKAKLDEQVENGRYYLKVTTLAGGETTLYPVGCMVSVENFGPAPFTLKKVTSTVTGRENEAKLFIDDLIIDGSGYDASTTATVHMDMPNGKSLEIDMIDGNTLTLLSPNSLKLHLQANTSTEPDGTWKMGYPICVVVRKGDGTELKKQITVV